ncbi:MAG: 3-deoxy-8-phosphooctulonate synthase [Tepidisphaeraceae bacterium]|jgi:2-dehydro-3-deoxyphosphooctonate aldolase (KDO 8-P synthase)
MTLEQITKSETAPLFVIAGPCVIESAELCLSIARFMRDRCRELGLPYIFKASFDKANRSAGASFRGPGLVDGLAVLRRVKEEVGVPVLTDVHETYQVATAGAVVDVLQVPAFLARQTDLLMACGRTGRVVNVKKGQFMSPQEMGNAVEKVRSTGNTNIMLTERGTFFGYNRLVNDITALAVMRDFGVPVVFDATHSTQQPGGMGNASGGNPKLTPLLARAAMAAGADGLFIECHPEPAKAKSDASSMITLEAAAKLLGECKVIAELRKTWK